MNSGREGWSGDHPEERLSAYVDGDLTAVERRGVEEHLESCEPCRRIASELEELASRARRLPDRGPDHDLWPGISQEIGRTGGSESFLRQRLRLSVPTLAAAALLIAALGSGVTWILVDADAGGTGDPSAPVAVGTTPGPATPGAGEFLYAMAAPPGLADLEARYIRGRDELDQETRAMLDRNLRLVDRAIAEARQALVERPENVYLADHLSRTVKRKAKLLTLAVRMTEAD